MLLKAFAAILLLAASQTLSAQKIFIGGVEGNRPLKWEDFGGTPDSSNPFFAYTAWKTNVKFSGVQFEGDKAILQGFEITLEFDASKSWVKKGKESPELLKHEQGHFDVGFLYIQDVLRTVAGTSFSRTGYKEEFQKIIKDLHKKYVDMGDQYDRETNHSIKKEEQAKWDLFFSKQTVR